MYRADPKLCLQGVQNRLAVLSVVGSLESDLFCLCKQLEARHVPGWQNIVVVRFESVLKVELSRAEASVSDRRSSEHGVQSRL